MRESQELERLRLATTMRPLRSAANRPTCSATTFRPAMRPTQRERNVFELLPERDRPPIKRRLTQAWQETDHAKALDQLTRIAIELDHEHPGAAASLREGM
jgi:hypothetical protein